MNIKTSNLASESYKTKENGTAARISNETICCAVLESATTSMMLVDSALNIIYLNPAAEQLLQASTNQLVNQNISKLGLNNQELFVSLKHSLHSNQPFTQREILWQSGIDSSITLDLTVTPITMLVGPCLLLELQRLDRFLKISKGESLSSTHQASKALIRGFAHEVKNPLGGIRGAAQLLAKAMGANELTDYTKVIIDEADRLRSLVDRMLGPKSPPKLEPRNIHEVLERVKNLLDAETNFEIDVIRDYDPSLPLVNIDMNQFIQAVLNIGRNSIQSLTESMAEKNNTDPKSAPKIHLRTRVVRQQTINNVHHRLAIRISVEDNGPGIPEPILETLFYPLVSGRAEGTGLGLAIAQAIIQQHHGIIECYSEPGKTMFNLLLPLEEL